MLQTKPHSLEQCTGYIASRDCVIHYTCNSPGNQRLQELGIEAIGADFGRDPREVLRIPKGVFEENGYEVPRDGETLIITTENLLRNLGK